MFLNCAAAFELDVTAEQLKVMTNAIETSLGRDRTSATRSTESRAADLDPLFRIEPGGERIDIDCVPAEPYSRPFVCQLLGALGILRVPFDGSIVAVRLPFGHSIIGDRALELRRNEHGSVDVSPLT